MTKLAAASRRSLLLGAGASVASAFMPYTDHATMPKLATVAQNAISPHGSQRFMAACMQQNMVDAIVVDHVNDTLNSRMLCLAPSGCSISDIVLAYPGWSMSGGKETNWPTSYTVTAAIEYPEGQFTPVFRDRSRSLTVRPGPSQAEFDPCPVSIPSGARFFVKTCARWTRGAFPLSSFTAVNRQAGEFERRRKRRGRSHARPRSGVAAVQQCRWLRTVGLWPSRRAVSCAWRAWRQHRPRVGRLRRSGVERDVHPPCNAQYVSGYLR